MRNWDDDDRAYNASIECPELVGWYPEWRGPDREFEAWLDSNRDSFVTDRFVNFPEIDPEDMPF